MRAITGWLFVVALGLSGVAHATTAPPTYDDADVSPTCSGAW